MISLNVCGLRLSPVYNAQLKVMIEYLLYPSGHDSTT